MSTRLIPVLAGLAVALGLYAWRGGHYPLAVDVFALGAVALMVAVGVRQLGERGQAQRAARAAAEERLRREAAVREAADVAITEARREAGAGTRGRVDVSDVLAVLDRPTFGMGDAARLEVARVLRARYELRTGGLDLDTDAYDNRHRPEEHQSFAWEPGDLDDPKGNNR